jgi:hypothetical protein
MSDMITFEQRLLMIWTDPRLMEKLINHVTNGGSAIDFADLLSIRYSDLMRYVRECPDRTKAYDQALSDRTEWAKERVLMEMRRIATMDIRDAYGPNGELLHPSQWPEQLRSALKGVKVREEFDREGEHVAMHKEVMFWDKNKALEMLAKNLKLLTDRVEHSGQVTLEDLVSQSYRKERDA